jgi:hypothetical protein
MGIDKTHLITILVMKIRLKGIDKTSYRSSDTVSLISQWLTVTKSLFTFFLNIIKYILIKKGVGLNYDFALISNRI